MDWNKVLMAVGGVYLAFGGLYAIYFFAEHYVRYAREDTARPASRSEQRRRYAWGIGIVMAVSLFFASVHHNAQEAGDDADQVSPPTSYWQPFTTAALILGPVLLLGLHQGFTADRKRTPRQRLRAKSEDERMDAHPDLIPVGDSNVPAYALCCVFNTGFAEGSRQDFMDLAIQRAGRPTPDDAAWLEKVMFDEDLRRSLYDMVAENASLMTDDAKFLFWHGLTSAVMDQQFAREIKTSARAQSKK
jgi:hypothetical protein